MALLKSYNIQVDLEDGILPSLLQSEILASSSVSGFDSIVINGDFLEVRGDSLLNETTLDTVIEDHQGSVGAAAPFDGVTENAELDQMPPKTIKGNDLVTSNVPRDLNAADARALLEIDDSLDFVEEFIPTNGQTAFTLAQAKQANTNEHVYLNGILQCSGDDYSLLGTDLTWLDNDGRTLSTLDVLKVHLTDAVDVTAIVPPPVPYVLTQASEIPDGVDVVIGNNQKAFVLGDLTYGAGSSLSATGTGEIYFINGGNRKVAVFDDTTYLEDTPVEISLEGVLNLPVFAAVDPTVVKDGDVWLRDDSGTVTLKARIGGVTKTLTFS